VKLNFSKKFYSDEKHLRPLLVKLWVRTNEFTVNFNELANEYHVVITEFDAITTLRLENRNFKELEKFGDVDVTMYQYLTRTGETPSFDDSQEESDASDQIVEDEDEEFVIRPAKRKLEQ
jgi:hypothetical protein